ncbi:MAG TPA: hypothetical protein VGS21_03080, partial [Acidimicrobiales bacterium]|nr:hypothetical protein [Acidimicrobiales bacterium]
MVVLASTPLGGGATLFAVDPRDGEVVNRVDLGGTGLGPIVVAPDGHTVWLLGADGLYSVDATSGIGSVIRLPGEAEAATLTDEGRDAIVVDAGGTTTWSWTLLSVDLSTGSIIYSLALPPGGAVKSLRLPTAAVALVDGGARALVAYGGSALASV